MKIRDEDKFSNGELYILRHIWNTKMAQIVYSKEEKKSYILFIFIFALIILFWIK